MAEKRKKLIRRLVCGVLCILVGVPIVIMPLSTVAIYEILFSRRFESSAQEEFDPSYYSGLTREESSFELDGKLCAGYEYRAQDLKEHKGIIIVSHGLGGGGHVNYLPIINAFAQNGYIVYAYDALGNDGSEGKLGGFPQGVLALDGAISHVCEQEKYSELPIMLFGHSWGAYSAANVLNLHPEVSAVALVSGFNESEDLIGYYAEKYAGVFSLGAELYVEIYERLKFGREYADISGVSGLEVSDALVFIAHSEDDEIVPTFCGIEIYEEAFGEDSRFTFVRYEDQGHVDILYSVEVEPDAELIESILNVFNAAIG